MGDWVMMLFTETREKKKSHCKGNKFNLIQINKIDLVPICHGNNVLYNLG